MSLTRRELIKIYHDTKLNYRRSQRDKDIIYGIDTLYHAIMNYIDCVESPPYRQKLE